jgi:hypothetical protein
MENAAMEATGRKILTDILGFEGPSVHQPALEDTNYGRRLYAGNAVLHLYDFGRKDSRDAWHEESSALEELGTPSAYGHFVAKNVFYQDGIPIGWFLSVRN